jgi:hypothetical protein
VREVVNILSKVLVTQFYRANAAFFLLIGTLAFGFMSKIEHEALAMFFVASPILMLAPIMIWGVYLLKVIRFNSGVVLLQENNFLREFRLLPLFIQYLSSFFATLSQLSPAIAYCIFLVIISIKTGIYSSGALAVFSLLCLSILGSVFLVRMLNNADPEKKTHALKRFIDLRFTRPLTQIYCEWVFRREPFMIMGTKIFTGLLIFAGTQLYHSESYDYRLIAMIIALTSCANLMIVYTIHNFENLHFKSLRNLPFKTLKRLLAPVLTFIILSIPENTVLIRYFPQNLSVISIPGIISFGISIQFLLYAALYKNGLTENFTRTMFILLMTLLILILFKIPLVIFIVINVILGSYLYTIHYYRYEPVTPD